LSRRHDHLKFMTTSKLSAAKEIIAQQRQKKLASALRTNLRRRKDQARDRAEDSGDSGDQSVKPADKQP
jgi:hypothetical protein